MPIDYRNYPPDWKTRIRPAILERAGHKCERCGAPNSQQIIRGKFQIIPSKNTGLDLYMDSNMKLFNANTGERLLEDFYWDSEFSQKAIKVVLTIAHLDHNTANNDFSNLKALCQRCHLHHDKDHHAANRKATLAKRKGLQDLF